MKIFRQKQFVKRFSLYVVATFVLTALVYSFTYLYLLKDFRSNAEIEIRRNLVGTKIGVQTKETKAVNDLKILSNILGENITWPKLFDDVQLQSMLFNFMLFNPDYTELSFFDEDGNPLGSIENKSDTTVVYCGDIVNRFSDRPWYHNQLVPDTNEVVITQVYTKFSANDFDNEQVHYIDFLRSFNSGGKYFHCVLTVNFSNVLRQLDFNKSFDYDLYISNRNGELIYTSDTTWKFTAKTEIDSITSFKSYFPVMYEKIINDSIEFYSDKENNYQIRFYQQDSDEEEAVLREDRFVVVKLPKSNFRLFHIIDSRLISVWAVLFIFSSLFVFYRLAKYQVENKIYKLNLERSQTKLKRNLQSQTNFFAVLSHDLKNSIGGAQSYAEFVEESIDTFERNEVKEHLKTIRRTLQNQFKLLIDILQWSKTELGITKMNVELCDVQAILKDLDSFFQIRLVEKNIQFDFENVSGVVVECDRNALISIFRNIIDNAIKYSFNDSKIIVKAVESKEHVHISIEDFGVGIPKKNLPNLLEMDSSRGTRGTNNEESTGFGLKLINTFVTKNKGKLQVESEEGKGTRFVVSFPLSR